MTAAHDRERLVALLTALDASPRALYRPVNRRYGKDWTDDYQIAGKHGHVLPDGDGFLLYVNTVAKDSEGHIVTEGTPRRWKHVKQRPSFAAVTQDGEDEGILRLDRLPTAAEAEIIRKVIGIKQRRHIAPEVAAKLGERLASARATQEAAKTALSTL
jgi:hypothetical protein